LVGRQLLRLFIPIRPVQEEKGLAEFCASAAEIALVLIDGDLALYPLAQWPEVLPGAVKGDTNGLCGTDRLAENTGQALLVGHGLTEKAGILRQPAEVHRLCPPFCLRFY